MKRAQRPRPLRSKFAAAQAEGGQVDLSMDAVWVKASRSQVESAAVADVTLHADLWRQFEDHWGPLTESTWSPLLKNCGRLASSAARVDARWVDVRLGLLSKTLETAFWWGFDLHRDEQLPENLRAAAARLDQIDEGIQKAARDLADLLDEREAHLEHQQVRSDWCSPGLDLWDLLQAAAADRQFFEWAFVGKEQLRVFLVMARTQSRPSPRLATLLRLVSQCTRESAAAARYPEDQVIVRKSKGRRSDDHLPDQVQRFFGMLLDSWSHILGRGLDWPEVRDCLDGTMLSALLCVAAGHEPSSDQAPKSLGESALRGARQRFNPDSI